MLKKLNGKKILAKIFLSAFAAIFLAQATAALTLLLLPAAAQAASPYTMKLEIPIPTLHSGESVVKFTGDLGPIADYVKAIYTYAVAAVGIVAAVVMMIGGLMWITAGGNASSISEAKAMITAALTGLVLVMVSFLMLNQVNPALVNLQTTNIGSLQEAPTQSDEPVCNWFTLCATCPSVGAGQIIFAEEDKTSGDVVAGDSECKADEKPGFDVLHPLSTYHCACWYETSPTSECEWTNDCDKEKYNCISFNSEAISSDNYRALANCGSTGARDSSGNDQDCACPIASYTFNTWPCQGNICNQKKDASPSLITLINCIGQNLPSKAGDIKISSISDSSFYATPPVTWATCRTQGNAGNAACAHSANACHYGGASGGDKSYAVDMVGDLNAIMAAAQKCSHKLINNECNHIHISAPDCSSDSQGESLTCKPNNKTE
jgi:hypothetical protein